jgi:hypothetical protein
MKPGKRENKPGKRENRGGQVSDFKKEIPSKNKKKQEKRDALGKSAIRSHPTGLSPPLPRARRRDAKGQGEERRKRRVRRGLGWIENPPERKPLSN